MKTRVNPLEEAQNNRDDAIPTLVILAGAPATGKTTIARRIARELQLPLVCKDDIKESLFDNLGWKDTEWSARVGQASFSLLFTFAERVLQSKRDCLLEANFKRTLGHHQRFLGLKQLVPHKPMQVYCQADTRTIIKRFSNRVENETRHPGHLDQMNIENLRNNIERGIYRMDIGGAVRTVDTTDFDRVDYTKIFDWLRRHLGR
jgi:predicted kinase